MTMPEDFTDSLLSTSIVFSSFIFKLFKLLFVSLVTSGPPKYMVLILDGKVSLLVTCWVHFRHESFPIVFGNIGYLFSPLKIQRFSQSVGSSLKIWCHNAVGYRARGLKWHEKKSLIVSMVAELMLMESGVTGFVLHVDSKEFGGNWNHLWTSESFFLSFHIVYCDKINRKGNLGSLFIHLVIPPPRSNGCRWLPSAHAKVIGLMIRIKSHGSRIEVQNPTVPLVLHRTKYGNRHFPELLYFLTIVPSGQGCRNASYS